MWPVATSGRLILDWPRLSGKRAKCPPDKMPPGQNAPHTGAKWLMSAFYNKSVCSVMPVKVCLFFVGMNKKTTFTLMFVFVVSSIYVLLECARADEQFR